MKFTPSVSTFPNVDETTPTENTFLYGILRQDFSDEIKDNIRHIREIPFAEYRKARKGLIPLFTPSGTFNPRNDDGLKNHSSLVCLDLDRLGDVKVDTLKEKSSKFPFVYATIKSLRGDGLKIFCKTDRPTTQANHKSVYKSLSSEINLGVKVCSASAFSQLCFYSIDPHPYLNPDCDFFPIPKTLPEIDFKKVDKKAVDEVLGFKKVDKKAVDEVLKKLKSFKNSPKFENLMNGFSDSEDQSNSGVDFSLALMIFFYLKSECWDGNQASAFSIVNKILNRSKSTWHKKPLAYKFRTLNKAWVETKKTCKDNFSEIQSYRKSLSAISKRKNNIEKIQWAIWQCDELNIKSNIKNIAEISGISRQHTSRILKMLP